MNVPPKEFMRVPVEALKQFVSTAAQTVGLPEERADLLGTLLSDNDARGVFSHGTQQIATYARLMRDGEMNPRPNVHVVRETPVSVLMDGDGGLGYFPAYEGTQRAIEKAAKSGVAVMASRNHGHFGAAQIYARMTLGQDLMAFVTSGHQMNLQPGRPVYSAGGGSPISFCTPTQDEPPMVLDFGAMHDLGGRGENRDAIADLAPAIVFRSIGLGAICQSWGGLLTGMAIEEARTEKTHRYLNQGAFVMCFRIDLFTDPATFRKEMDIYVRQVRELEPVKGFTEAHLPGGLEASREIEFRAEGDPVGTRHQARLEELAGELSIDVPW